MRGLLRSLGTGLLLVACVKTVRPEDPTALPPANFSPLEARTDALLATTEDGDQRDRLLEAKDLMVAMRGKDPSVQAVVLDYLDDVIAVEERGAPVGIEEIAPGETSVPAVEEVPLSTPGVPEGATGAGGATGTSTGGGTTTTGTTTGAGGTAATGTVGTSGAKTTGTTTGAGGAKTPVLATSAASPASGTTGAPTSTGSPATGTTGAQTPPAPVATPPSAATLAAISLAQAALNEGRFADAIAALEGAEGSEATRVRDAAIASFVRQERERAGHLLLEARAMPAGPQRTVALTSVRDLLKSLNTRYPNNPSAAEVQAALALVEQDLKKP